MRSDAATVDAFLAEQPDLLRGELAQLRAMVREVAPDAIETMRYGAPCYVRPDGPMLCGFTAQKHNLAFYVGRVPDTVREGLAAAGFGMGKGAVRFERLTPARLELLRGLLRVVVAEGITC